MKHLLLFALVPFMLITRSAFCQDLRDEQNAVWFEQRVGHIAISTIYANDEEEADLSYVYYLAAIGPRPASATKDYGRCLRDAVRESGNSFLEYIYKEADLFNPEIEPLYSSEQISRTRDSLIAARSQYKRAIISYCSDVGQTDPLRRFIDGTRLALVKRQCTNAICPNLSVPQAVSLNVVDDGERRERVFEALQYWHMSTGWKTDVNAPLLLGTSEDGGLFPSLIDVRPGVLWPALVDEKVVRAHFETAVAARGIHGGSHTLLSPVTVMQLGVPLKTVLRTMYAFRDPQDALDLAVGDVGRQSPEWDFVSLQDEVARARLIECRSYQGISSLPEISECAGYDFTSRSLESCSNNGPCLPPLRDKASSGAIIQTSKSLFFDPTQSDFPRPFSDESGSFKRLVDDYRSCASSEDVDTCLVSRMVPDGIAVDDCFSESGHTPQFQCLGFDVPTQVSLDDLYECSSFEDTRCLSASSLPENIRCLVFADEIDDLHCLDEGLRENASEIIMCSIGKDWSERLSCVFNDQVPEQIASVLECYNSTGDRVAFAACALSKNLPPDQVKMLSCATRGGGDPAATATCLAVDRLGLQGGQAVVVQCIASSGGVPIAAAGCMAGQFTLQELQGCKAAEFGQDGCFGNGNEIQKLAVLISGSPISSESVVGQIMIAHVDVANKGLVGAGRVFDQLSEGGEKTIEGIGAELESLRKNPLQTLANAPGNIINEAGRGLGNIIREIAGFTL